MKRILYIGVFLCVPCMFNACAKEQAAGAAQPAIAGPGPGTTVSGGSGHSGAPQVVTVVLPNRLVGQIREINGYNGWAGIGANNLVLKCVELGGEIRCDAYPYEPYPYEIEVVP